VGVFSRLNFNPTMAKRVVIAASVIILAVGFLPAPVIGKTMSSSNENTISVNDHLEESVVQAEEMLKNSQDGTESYALLLGLGIMSLKLKRYDNAIKYFQDMIAVESATVSVPNPFSSLHLYVAYVEAGKQKESKVILQKVVQLYQNNYARVYSDMGTLYFRNLKMLDKAIDAYKQAISIDSKDAYTYHELALVYFDQGRQVVGLAALKAAAELDNNRYGAEYKEMMKRIQKKKSPDFAMTAKVEQPGGIDLNEIPVQRKGEGKAIEFDPSAFENIAEQDVVGFTPVIINMLPIPSILPLLGLNQT